MTTKTFTITVTRDDGPDALTPYVHMDAILSFLSDWEEMLKVKAEYNNDSVTWDAVREHWYKLRRDEMVSEVLHNIL